MAEEIRQWLERLQLSQYADSFTENAIDFDLLSELTESDLEKMGIAALGHRKRIMRAIAALGDVQTAPGAARPSSASHIKALGAERRNLTVMFVDLVGSTSLSARLDPEEMREIIRIYQDTVTDEINRFDGHVAKYMGDGVLAYFGFPAAHEDDAERAVRAGLAIVEAVAQLDLPSEASAHTRVGIATGLVVVGDLMGEGSAREQAVIGDTPNLAARLQEISAPDRVIVAPSTHHLVAGLFVWEDLGTKGLKGIDEAVRAWSPVHPKAAESRFDAQHGGAVTPLVGRQHEVGLMLDRWQMACEGEGQVMLLQGEPGIGKSRLLHALSESVSETPHARLRYQCSPFRTNSVLFPVVEQMERAAGFSRQDDAGQKLRKLEAVLASSIDTLTDIVPLLAALLSLPRDERYPAVDLAPQKQKALTLAAIIDQLEGLSRRSPVLMTFEDAHWIDPTSLELLDLVIERIRRLPVFLVITFRPEFDPPWSGHAHMTTLTLNRLGRRQAAALVERRTGGKPLPEDVVAQIVAKTDGVPLFVEELTSTVLESDFLKDAGDNYVLNRPLQPLAIPTTLHDSLLARLDRHAPVKEIAQIGSVLGREFSSDLLAAVADIDHDRLAASLDQLVSSELIFRQGSEAEARYIFKHALVQDAAYQSLLKSRRHVLHARVAKQILESFPDMVEQQPEVLAHHLTEAGAIEDAITYWRLAGERAAERSAATEAIAHFNRSLDLLLGLPESLARDRSELQLQIALGPVYMTTGGWASPEVKRTYFRARELARSTGDQSLLFTVSWNLWHVHQTNSTMWNAKTLSAELAEIAHRERDPGMELQACHGGWTTSYHIGDLGTCRDLIEKGIDIYDAEQHHAHKFLFGGHDPGVCARNHGSCLLWQLGYPDQALTRGREAQALAERLGHPLSSITALAFGSFLHQFRGEPAAVQTMSRSLNAICEEHGIAPHFRATAAVMNGWATAKTGRTDEGLAEMQQGLCELRSLKFDVRLSYFLAILAEICGEARRYEDGLEALEEATARISSTSETRWEAELHRLRGELLRERGPEGHGQGEACLKRALDIARQQNARSLELRAATSLARLWSCEGRLDEAREILGPVYGWFTEGFETPDLMKAKTVLDAVDEATLW